MGADFIEKATPSFKKSWDRARVTLGTADLFTRIPDCVARTAAADIFPRCASRSWGPIDGRGPRQPADCPAG